MLPKIYKFISSVVPHRRPLCFVLRQLNLIFVTVLFFFFFQSLFTRGVVQSRSVCWLLLPTHMHIFMAVIWWFHICWHYLCIYCHIENWCCVCVHVCVCDVQVGKMDLWTESAVHWIYQNVQNKWKVYDIWKRNSNFTIKHYISELTKYLIQYNNVTGCWVLIDCRSINYEEFSSYIIIILLWSIDTCLQCYVICFICMMLAWPERKFI